MKVIIACREQVLAEALGCLLADCLLEEQVELIGSTTSGRQAADWAASSEPDLVLLEPSVAELNGVDTTRRIVADNADTQILILSRDPAEEPIAEALEAGARGCVSSDCDGEEMARAVKAVRSGQTYLSQAAAAALVESRVRSRGERPTEDVVFAKLTPREREVLQLLAEGNSSSEMADTLHISTKTVDTHRRNVMRKLECDNVPDLVKHAIRAGLTDLRPSS